MPAAHLPDQNGAATMINIYSPKDEFELAVIRGLLDSEEIQYFVFNDHFGSMRVGPQIDLFNKRSIMVAPEDVERAKAIIADVVKCSLEEEIQTAPATYSFGEKLRMIAEFLMFGWFVPGRKRPKE